MSQTPNQLTLFAADSHVSHTHAPGSDWAQRMTVRSGLKCLELYKRPGPVGSLVKMLLGSSIWDSTKVFLTWKEKVTPSRRLLFQLAPSTPRTEGTEFGLLQTPNVIDATGRQYQYSQGNHNKKVICLPGQIAMLPTPRANKHSPQSREDFTPNLAARIQMLPTPATRDYKGARKPETLALTGRNPETNSLEDALVGKNPGLKLQPAFVEWMMGYPDKWTELID